MSCCYGFACSIVRQLLVDYKTVHAHLHLLNCSKLQEMLRKSHLVEEHNSSMRHKQQEALSENQELKGKLINIRGKLTSKSVQMNHFESEF